MSPLSKEQKPYEWAPSAVLREVSSKGCKSGVWHRQVERVDFSSLFLREPPRRRHWPKRKGLDNPKGLPALGLVEWKDLDGGQTARFSLVQPPKPSFAHQAQSRLSRPGAKAQEMRALPYALHTHN